MDPKEPPIADVRALTWNIFHGRDHPPGSELYTLRSRFLKATERDATHAQVNRGLLAEFAQVLAADEGCASGVVWCSRHSPRARPSSASATFMRRRATRRRPRRMSAALRSARSRSPTADP